MTLPISAERPAEAGADEDDVLSLGTDPRLSARPHGYRTIALVVACALFMQRLDATVLTIALPGVRPH